MGNDGNKGSKAMTGVYVPGAVSLLLRISDKHIKRNDGNAFRRYFVRDLSRCTLYLQCR